jgi:hypothetical protein
MTEQAKRDPVPRRKDPPSEGGTFVIRLATFLHYIA